MNYYIIEIELISSSEIDQYQRLPEPSRPGCCSWVKKKNDGSGEISDWNHEQ